MSEFKSGKISNVLLIVLDTVRAKSTYVAGKPYTPSFERVAENGADFQKAIAPAPWTLPSHASIYTGLYPTEHGATAKHRFLSDEHTILPEILRDEGIRTGLFTANAFLTEGFNMDRGFETTSFIRGEENKLFDEGFDPVVFLSGREYESGLPRLKEIGAKLLDGPILRNVGNAIYFKYRQEVRQNRGTAEPLAWDKQAVRKASSYIHDCASNNDRFFAVVNLIGAHAPWEFDRERLATIGVKPESVAPIDRWKSVAANSEAQWPYAAGEVTFDETDREILTHLYHASVRRVDAYADELLTELENAGVGDDTLVVLTADHGEQIARDGVHGHTVTVDDSVAHIPLAIYNQGIPEVRIDEPVSLKDLYGTIIASLGIKSDARTLFDEEAQGEALIETYGIQPSSLDPKYTEIAERFGPRRALYTENGRAERHQQSAKLIGNEVVLSRLDELTSSFEMFDGVTEKHLSEDVQKRLGELGYV